MRDDFGALFALNASLRRDPTVSEVASGIPCGPFDQKFLNEMFFAGSSALSELARLCRASGIAPDETLIGQIAQATSRGLWAGQLTGTGDLAVATLGGILPDFVQGMRVGAVATASNTTTTPKLRVVNLGTAGGAQEFPILKEDGSALAVGDIKVGKRYRYEADGAGNVLISGSGLGVAAPITAANVISYNLASPQGVPNGATQQIAIAAIPGTSVDFATIASNTVTLTKAGAYIVTLSAGSQIFPTQVGIHANYFYIYVNGAHATGNGYQDNTNANHTNEAAVPLVTWFPAGTTLSAYTFLGGASGDVCQVNYASLTLLKVS